MLGSNTTYRMSRSHGEFAKSSAVPRLRYLCTSDSSPMTSCLPLLPLHPRAAGEAPPPEEEGRE
jgi:hypothetical protein